MCSSPPLASRTSAKPIEAMSPRRFTVTMMIVIRECASAKAARSQADSKKAAEALISGLCQADRTPTRALLMEKPYFSRAVQKKACSRSPWCGISGSGVRCADQVSVPPGVTQHEETPRLTTRGSLFGGAKRDYSAASRLTPAGSPIRALYGLPAADLVNRER